MKYIISSVNGKHTVSIFSDHLAHRCVARGIRESAIYDGDRYWEHTDESAGFFRLVNGRVQTYGESETLDLKPMPGDGLLIEQELGLTPRGEIR